MYCASRALPLFLAGSAGWTRKHADLVTTVYEQCRNSDRFGIGEKTSSDKRSPPWYPENAYHTYWALVVLKMVTARFEKEAQEVVEQDLKRLEGGMRLWARAKLAEEVGLHWGQSAMLDSDQLTWALTTFIHFEENLASNLRAQDLIRKAFDALASTQEPVGTWRHYRPLFVYSNVGNAYCYVYESFAFFLKAVLKRIGEGDFLEDVIRQFIDRLRRLRAYAEMTHVQHPDDAPAGAIGWSSGHRPADSKPEGWATASVFSFLQAYRRVLGLLARRDALRALPGPVLGKDSAALTDLIDRGDTWSPPGVRFSVAEDLISLIVNPVLMAPRPDSSEPDDQPIQKWQARSAILFGPPGASKTTLARCVAGSLGWKYVELHSSHFVAEGIQEVQRTADRIFAQLMELDHTVVLFDEPDELVREREGTPDAFGRFLTTSMLPKLALLWTQRRIIYFVATNHIEYFDAAIVRSERFDVLVFVPLPSFRKKVHALQERLGARVPITIAQAEIEAALERMGELPPPKDEGRSAKLPPDCVLAKFALIRWDQLEELAIHLRPEPHNPSLVVDARLLGMALTRIKDPRLGQLQPYLDYVNNSQYARRDFQRKPVYSVQDYPAGADCPLGVERTQNGVWLKCESGMCPDALPGYRIVRTSAGSVRLIPDEADGTRGGR